MAASGSGTKCGEDDDFASLFAAQHEELRSAKIAQSDLDLAFQFQMNEAMAASALLTPSAVAYSSSPGPLKDDYNYGLNDDFLAAAALFAEEIDRMEQDRVHMEQFKAEMRKMREDYEIRLHDQKIASEIFAIPEQEWQATGAYYEKPYMATGSTTGPFAATPIGYYFSLYFKGVVVENRGIAKLGAIAVVIFDSKNALVLEVSKPLILPEEDMRYEVAELEAFVHGLELALALELRRVVYFCVDFNVDHYLNGNQKPKEGKVAELVDRANYLKKRFLDCNLSLETNMYTQFAIELAKSSIAKQAGRSVREIILIKENCPICLEDVDTGKMFVIGRCHHRFCSSCMQKHVELKVLGREFPRCPEPDCGLELNINACRKFLSKKMCDVMDQLVKESSISAVDKVYCPNPRCSYLMSKTDALANTQSVAGTSIVETACRCVKCHLLFCINCKVSWHSNMSCDAYKEWKPSSSSADAKLMVLAGKEKWRSCPKCRHMVELAEGCNHIYCKCGHEFCYLCGREWVKKKATCSCPLWSEDKIIRVGRPGGFRQ